MVDDLVQETFAKTLQHLSLFDGKRSFTNWLLTIARNLYYDQCRRAGREKMVLSDPTMKPSNPRIEEKVVNQQTVKGLMETLPPEAQLLIELRVFQNIPFHEVSQITGEPEVNLRVRFHRTMTRLRAAIDLEVGK